MAIEVSICDYLGEPVGTLGVVGFDMEPPAGLDMEPPAGLEESPAGLPTLPGVPVGVVPDVGTFTPEAGLFLGLGAVVSGAVVAGTLLGVVELSEAPVAGAVVVPVVDPGFFMLPVVDGFLVFLVLGLV
jgi:hypothetical protein